MKKSSKILGSIALSAALVMGTAAPAFATDEYDLSDDINKTELQGDNLKPKTNDDKSANLPNPKAANVDTNASGASTVVRASTYTSQLNVTIPLNLPLMFNTIGGAGMAPNAGAYYIKNNSSTDITVTAAEYKLLDNAWALNASAFTSEGEEPSTGVQVGDVHVKLEPVEKKTAFKALEIKKGGTAVTDEEGNATGAMIQNDLKWGIAAQKNNNGTKLGLAVSPSSSKLNKSVDITNLAAITYTVQVGADPENMVLNANGSDKPSDPITSIDNALTREQGATGEVIKKFFSDNKVEISYLKKTGESATETLTAPVNDTVYKIEALKYSTNGGTSYGQSVTAGDGHLWVSGLKYQATLSEVPVDELSD